jgi:hypothetical protein
MKRSPIKRYTALRSRPKKPNRTEAAFDWKDHGPGYCECGCDRFSLHRERHHVLERGWLVKNGFGRYEYDQRNSMMLHPHCHANHTSAHRRIPIESVPEAALAFAVDLLGEDRAALELSRRYGVQVTFRRAA